MPLYVPERVCIMIQGVTVAAAEVCSNPETGAGPAERVLPSRALLEVNVMPWFVFLTFNWAFCFSSYSAVHAC